MSLRTSAVDQGAAIPCYTLVGSSPRTELSVQLVCVLVSRLTVMGAGDEVDA